jgi:uncharacterized protein (UPF0276 family)
MKHSISAHSRHSETWLQELGVGITYSSAIEPMLEKHPELFDIVEVEPQTTWIETRDRAEPYRILNPVLEHIAQLPGRKLVHSIDVPVGGTVRPEPAQLILLERTIARLNSPWFSEHLSFNSTSEFRTGFFLPPRQTPEGVDTTVVSVRDLKAALPVPVAVETGVNYLRPRRDEMTDGAFVAAVADASDCGILLDLHNIFANALNGRQPVDEFLAHLPLDRVWEIHLAGGFELQGFWLDAHSGAIPNPLFEISKRIVSTLPNLKAIIFEMFPSFVPIFGFDGIRAQMERLHELWTLKGKASSEKLPIRAEESFSIGNPTSPAMWERALGSLVIGRKSNEDVARELEVDPGIGLVNHLISEFRGSMIVNVLRLTSRLIMLSLGADIFRAILEDFWSKTPPQQFASSEAEAFADYLVALDLKIPQLAKILEFERAVLATLMDGQVRVIVFDFDPLPMLRALAEGHLPEVPSQVGLFEIEVTPDGAMGTPGVDQEATRQIFPFH